MLTHQKTKKAPIEMETTQAGARVNPATTGAQIIAADTASKSQSRDLDRMLPIVAEILGTKVTISYLMWSQVD
jgi:hypothetical protein